jgi:nucleoside-diphosphate-sugar epimerase
VIDERILVTGASGFVGRRTLAPLVSTGANVHLLCRHPLSDAPAGATQHGVNLHDHAAVDALMRDLRPTRLLHLAWIVTPGEYVTSPENVQWVASTLHLVDSFARHGGRRVVCAGTSAEYDWSNGVCSELMTPTRPTSLYAACKLGVYHILEHRAAPLAVSFSWGRIFFMYGPGEYEERLVPSLMRAAGTGTSFRLAHPGHIRDYMHVDDVAAAFVALLQSDINGAVNVGSGDGVTLAELARTIGQEMGRELRLEVPDDAKPDAAPVVVADVARLRDEVGWEPRYSLTDGIRDTVRWWKMREKAPQV